MARKTKEGLAERSFQVRLPAALHESLKRQAAREDRPLARIVRAALREYLEASA